MNLTNCCALLCLAIPMWGQEPPPVKPAELCRLEGRVVDAQTGEPVKHAKLILRDVAGRDTPSDTATSDAGSFAMKDIAPGRYRLSAERNGYVRQEYGARGATRPGIVLSLSPGQRLAEIAFRLVPHGVIHGRVLDADGELAPNVRIQALRSVYSHGKRRLSPAANAVTNDLGEYRLFGLPAGRYWISATYTPAIDFSAAVDRTSGESRPEEGYAPVYYPGTSDPSAAAPIDLSAGAKIASVDFSLRKTRTARIQGRVGGVAGIGSPSGGIVLVTLAPRAGGGLGDRLTNVRDAKGSFEIRAVPPGSYTLSAIYFDAGRRYGASQLIEVSAENLDNVALELAPGKDVGGIVKVAEETPVNLEGVTIQIDSRDVESPFGGISGRLKQDRTFMLTGVTAGEYAVEVTGLPENHYLKSVRMGRDDVLESGLVLRGGTGGSELEVTLSGSGGAIDGVVQNNEQQPAPGVRVVLVPDERKRNQVHLFKSVETDQYGHFTLKGIAPGDYKLFAFEDADVDAAQDPSFLKDFEKLGEALTVQERARAASQLKLISNGSSASGQKSQP